MKPRAEEVSGKRFDWMGTHPVGLGLLFGVAGFVINLLPLDLGFGLHFIFGGCVFFVVLRFAGPRMAIPVIGVSALATIQLWGHPWAWIIFVVEACFLIRWRRTGTSLVIGDILFWLCAGVPMVFVFYHLFIGMDLFATWVVAAKQAINGIAIAAVASLLNYMLASSLFRNVEVRLPVLLVDRMILIGLLPIILFVFFDNQRRGEDVQSRLARDLEIAMFEVERKVLDWSYNEIRYMTQLGAQGLARGGVAADIRQELIAESFARSGLNSIGIYDLDGQQLYSLGQPDGHPDVLTESAKRRLENLAKNHDGSALLQTLALNQAIQLCIPVVNENGISGFVVASYRRAQLRLEDALMSGGFEFRLLDSDGQVLAQNGESAFFDDASYIRLSFVQNGEIFEVLRPRKSGTSVMVDFSRSFLASSKELWTPVGVLGLDIKTPFRAAVAAYLYEQAVTLTAGFVLLLLLSVLANFLFFRIGRGFAALADVLRNMSLEQRLVYDSSGYPIREFRDVLQIAADTNDKIMTQSRDIRDLGTQLRNLTRSMPILAYTMERQDGAKWQIVFTSPTGSKMDWFDDRMLVDRDSWLDGVHPDDQAIAETAISDFRKTGFKSAEYRIRTRSGEWRWICDDLEIISRNPDTGLQVASGAITDVHERRTSAERLNSTSRLITLGEMATGMAHEINQPLNTIRMAAENALLEIAAPAKGDVEDAYIAEKLDRIVSQTDRAAGIIDHMRIFGRRTSDLPEPFGVSDAVEGALKIVEPQLRVLDIDVQTDPAPQELPELIGHQQLLEQVLINLMLNAKDAIRTRIEASGENGVSAAGIIDIRFEFQKLAGTVVIEVGDNGGGVPDQIASRLFDPFFTTKPAGQGTGLGLSVSYGIVSEMGGRISFRNNDVGAVFQISLPVSDIAGEANVGVDSVQSS